MGVLASFFDPSADGFDIIDTAQLIGIAVAVSGIIAAWLRWNSNRVATQRTAERERMKLEVLEAVDNRTQSIQPGYRNGGTSLTDIRDTLGYIRARLDDHIDNHHKGTP